jgi:hypothetical protein
MTRRYYHHLGTTVALLEVIEANQRTFFSEGQRPRVTELWENAGNRLKWGHQNRRHSNRSNPPWADQSIALILCYCIPIPTQARQNGT